MYMWMAEGEMYVAGLTVRHVDNGRANRRASGRAKRGDTGCHGEVQVQRRRGSGGMGIDVGRERTGAVLSIT